MSGHTTRDRTIGWLRLARLPGVGPVLVKRLLEALGSPEGILSAHPAALGRVEGIGTHRASQIVANAAKTEKPAREEWERAVAEGVTILGQEDDRYPPALRTIPDSPLVLYVRGELKREDALAVGIVGARQCTLYGREQAGRFGHDLADRGVTVISGGARGIDTAAHRGALRAKGRTIVVQGCGALHTYPPENAGLYEEIVASGSGAVISELPLDAPPTKENFPPRNRIIAGMSLGVLVVEANLRSGSLITARLAAADYGREVFAIPGRVDSPASAGTHHLLKSGMAHLVESVEDVLEQLGDVGAALRAEKTEGSRQQSEGGTKKGAAGDLFAAGSGDEERKEMTPAVVLTSVQEKIVGAIPAAGGTIDEILERTGLAAGVVMAELTMLQIRGVVARAGNNRFGRKV